MDVDFGSVDKNAKKKKKQYPSILTSRLVNNTHIYIALNERKGGFLSKVRLWKLQKLYFKERAIRF